MRLRFAPALLIERDACGFLKVDPQLIRLCRRKACDHGLRDDCVASRTETGAEEDFLHVALSHLLMIDVVGGNAFARHHAADGELFILPPGALHGMVGIVEHELDARAPEGFSRGGAREDEFGRRFAAQLAPAPFAEHPAHGVDDVGLPAAIGPHDHDVGGADVDHGRIRKAFEAGYFDLAQAQLEGTPLAGSKAEK